MNASIGGYLLRIKHFKKCSVLLLGREGQTRACAHVILGNTGIDNKITSRQAGGGACLGSGRGRGFYLF